MTTHLARAADGRNSLYKVTLCEKLKNYKPDIKFDRIKM